VKQMTDQEFDIEGEDSAINKLIQMSRAVDSKPFDRPPDECIEAYLTGRANDVQKKTIADALISSAEFRREMLRMSQDMESLAESSRDLEFAGIATPVPPRLSEFLGESHSRPRRPKLIQQITGYLRDLISVPFRFRYAVPALEVAAALIVIVIICRRR